MKRNPYFTLLLTAMAVLISGLSRAQSPGFVQQDIIKVAGITTDAQIYPLTPAQKQTTRSYYDGLGRTLQNVGVQASPAANDMIQPMAYDNLGRQTTAYLPYTAASTGGYHPAAISSEQPAFYENTTQHLVATDNAPYTQQVFENSPLQRLLQAGMVGSGFQPEGSGTQHYKTISYRPNSTADGNILQWNPDGSYTTGTYYAVNSLAVTDGKDEDGIETLSFADLAGHTILKRQLLTSGNLDTYYIYDNAGMLIYVVPPNAIPLLSPGYNLTIAPLSNLVFHYVYDTRGRITQRTVPGKGVMSIIYDPVNRPVLMQDANMQTSHTWNYIKYDAKGRAVSQGIYTDITHTSPGTMQTYVSGLSYTIWYESRSATLTNGGYYTNNVFPTSGTSSLAYAYYDDYNMTEGGSPNFSYSPQGLLNEETQTAAAVKGMPTMLSKTTVGNGLSGTWLTSVTFYDKRLNPIQTQSNNQLNYTNATTVTDYKTIVPDFMGVPQVSKVVKVTSSGTTSVQTNLTYDANDRLSTITQQYNGGAAIQTAAYTYNELGQLVNKGLDKVSDTAYPPTITLNGTYAGTQTFIAGSSITITGTSVIPSGATFKAYIANEYLQSVDMRYNIRGQLLSINNSKLNSDGGVTTTGYNDVFGMQFSYDVQDGNIGNTASYDGKLTAVKWMSRDASGNESYERSYKYNYDGVNRYTSSNYAERTQASAGAFNNNVGGFDESGITYDSGGNISTLNRNSSTQGTNSNVQIDNLTYTYSTTSPDQLTNVTDGIGANYTGAGFRNLTGSAGPYTYDTNGNLTVDPYKGLSIGYDVLNRTDKITITTSTNRFINYTYDAGGSLIRKQSYDNNVLQTTTDYIDGFVYVNNSLSYFPMPEGRVLNVSGTLKQEYVLADQQGNARISFQDNGTGNPVVTQENSYYAFGLIMPHSPVATPTTPNKQLYNGGSEWQNDYSNLPDYYQTFNRNYDAAIGRFVGVDPQAESVESMTSYQYAGNNPVVYNDPLGDKIPPFNENAPAPSNSGGIDFSANNYNAGNMDGGDWQDEGGFDDEGAFSSDQGAGGRSFWLGAEESGGALDASSGNIVNVYHAGDGTSDDPHTGISQSDLTNVLNVFNAGGNVAMSFSQSGFFSILYNNAKINAYDPNDNIGEAGIIDFGNSNGEYGATAVGNTNSIANTYPNEGFAGKLPEWASLDPQYEYLDRFGGTGPNSQYLAPRGTPIEQRSLPEGTDLEKYDLFRRIKGFYPESRTGPIADENGNPTGGIQIQTRTAILNEEGLEIIPGAVAGTDQLKIDFPEFLEP